MLAQFRVRKQSLTLQMVGSLVHVKRVPASIGSNDEFESHDPLLLRFMGANVDASLGIREHGLGQGMPGFALGEASLTFHPKLGVLDPVQHEEGSLDPTDFAKREIQPVLLPVGAELSQHVRGFYGPGLDTGCQSHDNTPQGDFIVRAVIDVR